MSWAYYNEFDPSAAAWLRELMAAGLIAPGIVDERSIEDVLPNDLTDFTQCHFFAGIGGWSHALRLAGWPDDRPVWTGSCPCQPFSTAGQGKGFEDERHLWPAWHWLIQQCHPAIIFGEQVANADAWFDLVSGDLEAEGYTVGSAVLGAHSVGAPHIRQRLYWVGDADRGRWSTRQSASATARQGNSLVSTGSGMRMADDDSPRLEIVGEQPTRQKRTAAKRSGAARRVADTDRERYDGWRSVQADADLAAKSEGPRAAGFWSNVDWIACRDGKARPAEPGTFPLAHGVSGRVGLLRGYGNAIVPQVAAAFIEAVKP